MIFGYKPGTPKEVILKLPLIGMALFVILYVIAANMYPGGSWNMPGASGFSFWNNYLCDLLDHYAINGQLNDGRYVARAALGFLCGALLVLWFYLPSFFPKNGINLAIMWSAGILALGTTFFLSAGTHDITVRIAGILGVIAFVSLYLELYRIGQSRLFYFGLLCLLIFLINYYIYETGMFIHRLPVIQKITFVCFISWFVILNLLMIKKAKNTRTN